MKLMKAVRPLVGCVALLSIVAGATGRGRDSAALLASEPIALTLNLHFTSSDSLPIVSRRALMAEADSIWKNGHVRLKWLRESTEADEGDILRVLVVARPVPKASEYAAWTVAELLRLSGTQATAIASTIGAKKIVDESRWELLAEPTAMQEQRLGLVLGRAVSHEIGHYLLQTNTHATRGLMRARIDAREFADLRSGTFQLDRAAEAHMASIAAKNPLAPDTLPNFSYPAR
jgi:hypothetical protein